MCKITKIGMHTHNYRYIYVTISPKTKNQNQITHPKALQSQPTLPTGDTVTVEQLVPTVQHLLPPCDIHQLLLIVRKPITSFHRKMVSTRLPPSIVSTLLTEHYATTFALLANYRAPLGMSGIVHILCMPCFFDFLQL